MSKIVVTGGSGFIGNRLIKRLYVKGENPVVIDITPPNHNEPIPFWKTDITDISDLNASLWNSDVKILYHLAGVTLNKMRKDPYKGTILNVQGTLNVLESCRLNDIAKIIFASTFYVYDGIDESEDVDEETPLNPTMPELFGQSKLIGEYLIKKYAELYGLKYVILRFGSAFGTGNCSNIIKYFLDEGFKKEKPLVIWGKGERCNQYTYVNDIVDGCYSAIDKVNETYNLISPEVTSINELATLLTKKYEFKFKWNLKKTEGASMSFMSSDKAIRELQWKPMKLEKAIDKIVEVMTKRV